MVYFIACGLVSGTEKYPTKYDFHVRIKFIYDNLTTSKLIRAVVWLIPVHLGPHGDDPVAVQARV